MFYATWSDRSRRVRRTTTTTITTQAGLEKNPGFKKKTSPVGFFLFFWVFWVLNFFVLFFLHICPEERVLMVFSVSRILLGASRR
jgi:hypothetical protein